MRFLGSLSSSFENTVVIKDWIIWTGSVSDLHEGHRGERCRLFSFPFSAQSSEAEEDRQKILNMLMEQELWARDIQPIMLPFCHA